MERAGKLIEPYIQRDDVVGIYLLGSASRPYRDARSDYDFEVVIRDDAYPAIPADERLVYVLDEGPPRRVDYEFYLRPQGELERLVDSRHDIFHGPYRNAIVLHDPQGVLAPLIERLAALPEEIRADRLRVHYLEVYEGLARAGKTLARERPGNVGLLLAESRRALVKLLFLQAGAWPTPWHWAREELNLLEASTEPLDALEALLNAPDADGIRPVIDTVNAWLESVGETFHGDVRKLFDWLYLTPEGKRAFDAWGAR